MDGWIGIQHNFTLKWRLRQMENGRYVATYFTVRVLLHVTRERPSRELFKQRVMRRQMCDGCVKVVRKLVKPVAKLSRDP